jgi:hypothetical protein
MSVFLSQKTNFTSAEIHLNCRIVMVKIPVTAMDKF